MKEQPDTEHEIALRIAQLRVLASNVDACEERHNEVVDVYAAMNSTRKDFSDEVQNRAVGIRDEFVQLREEIAERLGRVRKGMLLLSLIAQEEEVRPLRNRVDNQQYELYVDKDWFLRRLTE